MANPSLNRRAESGPLHIDLIGNGNPSHEASTLRKGLSNRLMSTQAEGMSRGMLK